MGACGTAAFAAESKPRRSHGMRWGGNPCSSPRSPSSLPACWRTATPRFTTMAISQPSKRTGQLSIFSSVEPPANRIRSRDLELDWLTRAVTWPLNSFRLLAEHAPAGWYGRTSPACCPRTAAGTLEPSLGAWQNAGMGSPTVFLTLSISEWPSDGAASSLSDILEIGDVPLRYYLSARACRGILRRAERRELTLPPALKRALDTTAGVARAATPPTTSK